MTRISDSYDYDSLPEPSRSIVEQQITLFTERLKTTIRPDIHPYLVGLDDELRVIVLHALVEVLFMRCLRAGDAPRIAYFQNIIKSNADKEAICEAYRFASSVAHRELHPIPVTVLSESARGGASCVYECEHDYRDEPLALKVFNTDVSRERFLSETAIFSQLDHPNILQVYERGFYRTHLAMVMELAHGGTLEQHAEIFCEDHGAAVTLVTTLVDALSIAHAHDVIHRDLTPANIVFMEKNMPVNLATAKIIDFGLVKDLTRVDGPTRYRDTLGSLPYMAPEQAETAYKATIATDIYGLGAILFFLLTTRPPHPRMVGEDENVFVKRIKSQLPTHPSRLNPACSRRLDAIVDTCLHPLPSRRYDSLQELRHDLQRVDGNQKLIGKRIGILHELQHVLGTCMWSTWIRRITTILCAIAIIVITIYVVQLDQRRANQYIQDIETSRSPVMRARNAAMACDLVENPEFRGLLLETLTVLPNYVYPSYRFTNQVVAEFAFSPDASQQAAILITPQTTTPVRSNRTMPAEYTDPLAEYWGGLKISKSKAMMWSPHFDESPRTISESYQRPTCLAFSSDGRTLAIGDSQGRIIFRTTGDKPREEHSISSLHPPGIIALQFTDNDRQLFAITKDLSTYYVVNANDSTMIKKQDTPSFSAERVEMSDDGTVLVLYSGQESNVVVNQLYTPQKYLIPAGKCVRSKGQQPWVAISSNGKTVAAPYPYTTSRNSSRQSNYEVGLWRIATSGKVEALGTLIGHTNAVTCGKFTSDGQIVVTGSQAGSIRFWSVESGAELFRIQLAEPVRFIELHSDGKTFAVGSCFASGYSALYPTTYESGSLHTWSSSPAVSVIDMRAHHRDGIDHLRLSPDGIYVITTDNHYRAGTISIWDTVSGLHRETLKGHTSKVSSIGFLATKNEMVSASWDGSIRIWDLASKRPVSTLVGHNGPVFDLAIDSSESMLCSTGSDGTIRLWSLVDERQLAITYTDTTNRFPSSIDIWAHSLPEHDSDSLLPGNGRDPDRKTTRLAFVPETDKVVAVGMDHQIYVWDYHNASNTMIRLTQGGSRDRTAYLSVNRDGTKLLTVSRSDEDNAIYLWDLTTSTQDYVLFDTDVPIRAASFSPNSSNIVFVTDGDAYISTLDSDGRYHNRKFSTYIPGGSIGWAQFNSSGTTIVTVDALLSTTTSERYIRIWDVHTCKEIARFSVPNNSLTRWDMTPDCETIVTSDRDMPTPHIRRTRGLRWPMGECLLRVENLTGYHSTDVARHLPD